MNPNEIRVTSATLNLIGLGTNVVFVDYETAVDMAEKYRKSFEEILYEAIPVETAEAELVQQPICHGPQRKGRGGKIRRW